MKQSSQYDILGIGAPVVDHIIKVEEEFVDSLEGGKGGMLVINYHTLSEILEKFGGEATLLAGGSGANTIKGLAHLGHSTALWGKIGNDVTGQIFTQSIEEANIAPLLLHSHTPTAHALCLVTPDGERTMRTYLGASLEMYAEDLTPDIFRGVKLVHFEGYNLLKGDLTLEAMKLAKSEGALISIDLASYEIVHSHHDLIKELLQNFVDIVIANADEAWALLGLPPEESCRALNSLCETAVVLFGEGGCWVSQSGTPIHGAPFPAKPVDTTGAGDLFASGFLHAYLKGYPIEECAKLGNRTGSAVVQVLGAEIPPVSWELIKPHLLAQFENAPAIND